MSLFHLGMYRLGLRQLLRTKKFLFALLVSLIPLVAGIIILADDMQDEGKRYNEFDDGFTESTAFLILGGTVPFVALMLAGGHLADEVEDRTLTYLLVRPVPRATLYISRYLPVALIAVALAMLQVVLLGMMRLLAYAIAGNGARVEYTGTSTETIDAGLLILRLLPTHMLAAGMEALVLTALFGFISMIATKFHFFWNLVVYLLDLMFGHLGGGGLGAFTSTYWILSFIDGMDPTVSHLVSDAVIWPIVPFWMLAWTIAWLALGVRQVKRRDFNITSAAT